MFIYSLSNLLNLIKPPLNLLEKSNVEPPPPPFHYFNLRPPPLVLGPPLLIIIAQSLIAYINCLHVNRYSCILIACFYR